MKLAFSTMALTTGVTPSTAVAISRDGADVPVSLNGGLVILYAPKSNSADVLVGPAAAGSFFYELEAGQYYALPGCHLPQFVVDLATWFVKSTGVSQAVEVIYVRQY